MNDDQYRTMINTLTEYDRQQSTRKSYNRYALGQYFAAAEKIRKSCEYGTDLRQAVCQQFLGRLCDLVLKALGMPKMTENEARGIYV